MKRHLAAGSCSARKAGAESTTTSLNSGFSPAEDFDTSTINIE